MLINKLIIRRSVCVLVVFVFWVATIGFILSLSGCSTNWFDESGQVRGDDAEIVPINEEDFRQLQVNLKGQNEFAELVASKTAGALSEPLNAISMALRELKAKPTVTLSVPPPPPPEPQRPVGRIRVKTNAACGSCQQLKRDVVGYTGLEFEFIEVPMNQTLPVLEWDTRAGRQTYTGWGGLSQFVNYYNTTVPPMRTGADFGQSPTPLSEVRRVLAMLRPQPNETFVDYGCGDGRWLIEAVRTYRCRAVGIDIDPEQVAKARQAVAEAGLTDRVRIIEGDAITVNVEAQVGVAYLYPDVLTRLKPKLLNLNRFATYMHNVDGVAMVRSGDTWLYEKSTQTPTQQQYSVSTQQRYAWYGGQAYSGRVCNNPRCSMCNSIARQLGF